MRLNRATSAIPKKMEDIEQNVLYIGEAEYYINGVYRMWITGKAKMGSQILNEGYYSGQVEATLQVPRAGGVIFDRFPYPEKKIISPPEVPDIIEQDDISARIDILVEQRMRQFQDDLPEVEEIRQLMTDEQIYDNSDEMYVSDIGLVDLDQVSYGEPGAQSHPPADPQPSESEADNPRVGGGPEARGEPSVEPGETV